MAAVTVAVAALHSILASHTAKEAAERAVGARRRNALYRPAYNVIAVLSFGWLLLYVRSLPARTIYLGHALPNALTASLTLGGLLLSAMVAGTVLVENVFAWPGLGSTIVSSILTKDYQVVQAIVLVYGVGVLVVNTLVDVALALIDPRSTIRED